MYHKNKEIKILQNEAYTQIKATGGETVLDFTFPVLDPSHLKVEDVDARGAVTKLTLFTDYTVSGVGQEAGGSITLSDTTYPGGAIQGHKYNLILDVPAERATDFNDRGDFKASVINKEFDLLTQAIQCVTRDTKQSVKAPLGENPDTVMADIHEARNVATAKAAEASSSAALAIAASENATTAAELATEGADGAKKWAIGQPSEPTGGSAKHWALQAFRGQAQADWEEDDNTAKSFIKNKPLLAAKISDLFDDTNTAPLARAIADADGNNIVTTYATKTDLIQGLAGKQAIIIRPLNPTSWDNYCGKTLSFSHTGGNSWSGEFVIPYDCYGTFTFSLTVPTNGYGWWAGVYVKNPEDSDFSSLFENHAKNTTKTFSAFIFVKAGTKFKFRTVADYKSSVSLDASVTFFNY